MLLEISDKADEEDESTVDLIERLTEAHVAHNQKVSNNQDLPPSDALTHYPNVCRSNRLTRKPNRFENEASVSMIENEADAALDELHIYEESIARKDRAAWDA